MNLEAFEATANWTKGVDGNFYNRFSVTLNA